MSGDKINKKSFFTPCRSVGLKRRSIGTPLSVQNLSQVSLTSPKSSGCVTTPKRIVEKTDRPSERHSKKVKLSSYKTENGESAIPAQDKFLVLTDDIQENEEARSPPLKKQISSMESENSSPQLKKQISYTGKEAGSPQLEEKSSNTEVEASSPQLEEQISNTVTEASSSQLENLISDTEARITRIKNEIQNLKSISLNAKQHDIGKLNELIWKWRNGCQEALHDLLTEYKNRDNAYSMSTLLSTLGIPPSLVHYSKTEADFCE